MEVSNEIYEQLRKVESVSELEPHEALNTIARLVDGSWDRGDAAGTDQALFLAEELLAPERYESLDEHHKQHIHYTVANAWYGREHLAGSGEDDVWSWESEPLEKQIFHLRSALLFGDLGDLTARIATNLANGLNRVGRFIEAVALYDRAIELAPDYGMPLANRGIALREYGRFAPDPGHGFLLWHHAADALERAMSMDLDTDGMRGHLGQVLDGMRQELRGYRPPRSRFSMGRSKSEREYRSWVLRERLFLSPLNDLGHLSIASHDPLSPVSIVLASDEVPPLFGFFNAMKQEYASARFMLYQGLKREGVHFSDRSVKLVNTLNYPVHRLGMEEVKVAYRLAYSLFDKVGNFINAYFELGIPERAVSLRSLWFEGRRGKKASLRAEFRGRRNLPLRGLFWISKDLYELRDEHRSVLDPEAQELAEVRHAMEHKYLEVVEWLEGGESMGERFRGLQPRMISAERLERKALRMMKLARAALIHLCCAVSVEERKRAKSGELTLPMFLDDWQDDWKQ